jgi:hypothetical protein
LGYATSLSGLKKTIDEAVSEFRKEATKIIEKNSN